MAYKCTFGRLETCVSKTGPSACPRRLVCKEEFRAAVEAEKEAMRKEAHEAEDTPAPKQRLLKSA